MLGFHHIVNVEGAIVKDDRYLMVVRSEAEEHAAGTLSFVGGKVEFESAQAEILEETLKREILEEVAVRVDDIHYVTSTGFLADDGTRVVNIVFLCRWQSGEARAVDPDEVAAIEWLTADEIFNHPKTPVWIKGYLALIEARR